MKARQYTVRLTGETPLLMHHDNLSASGELKRWREIPGNKAISVAGDDRSPAHTWMGYLYTEAGRVCVPSDNLMTMLREGGKACPTGKGQKTFKSQTQSGIIVDQSAWPIETTKGIVDYTKLKPLIEETDFAAHEAKAIELGFWLFVKRAKIGAAKHVRVRPRFDSWAVEGTVTVLDDQITKDVLQTILDHAGTYCGMCDWRPSSPKAPGPFGKFSATVKGA